jgi:hypothetical protein
MGEKFFIFQYIDRYARQMFYSVVEASGISLGTNEYPFIERALLAFDDKVDSGLVAKEFGSYNINFSVRVPFEIAKSGINLADIAAFQKYFVHTHFKYEASMLQEICNFFRCNGCFLLFGQLGPHTAAAHNIVT